MTILADEKYVGWTIKRADGEMETITRLRKFGYRTDAGGAMAKAENCKVVGKKLVEMDSPVKNPAGIDDSVAVDEKPVRKTRATKEVASTKKAKTRRAKPDADEEEKPTAKPRKGKIDRSKKVSGSKTAAPTKTTKTTKTTKATKAPSKAKRVEKEEPAPRVTRRVKVEKEAPVKAKANSKKTGNKKQVEKITKGLVNELAGYVQKGLDAALAAFPYDMEQRAVERGSFVSDDPDAPCIRLFWDFVPTGTEDDRIETEEDFDSVDETVVIDDIIDDEEEELDDEEEELDIDDEEEELDTEEEELSFAEKVESFAPDTMNSNVQKLDNDAMRSAFERALKHYSKSYDDFDYNITDILSEEAGEEGAEVMLAGYSIPKKKFVVISTKGKVLLWSVERVADALVQDFDSFYSELEEPEENEEESDWADAGDFEDDIDFDDE